LSLSFSVFWKAKTSDGIWLFFSAGMKLCHFFKGKQLHVMLSAIVEFQRALLTSSSNIN
jgi:hypothetical protein